MQNQPHALINYIYISFARLIINMYMASDTSGGGGARVEGGGGVMGW